MAYTGQDLIDYQAGDEYLPQRYYQQNFQRNITGPEIMGSGITSTAAARPYVLPPLYGQQERGDRGGGFGRWGNLDESNMKMFDKNVFSTDMVSGPPSQHAPMTGSFKPGQVQGFYNPQLGQYQTFEGKNINHLGINVKPLIASALERLGGKKKPLFKHDIGDTEGLFTLGTESAMGKIKKGWEEEKDKWSGITGIKKYKAFRKAKKDQRIADEIQADNLAKVQAVAAEQQAAKTGPPRSHTGEAIASKDVKDIGGGFHKYKDAATASKYEGSFAQGGRIGYNRGRVVNPGGYAGDTDFTTWLQKQDIDIKTLNLDDLTSLQLEWDKIRPKHLDQADGGRVRFFYGGIATAL